MVLPRPRRVSGMRLRWPFLVIAFLAVAGCAASQVELRVMTDASCLLARIPFDELTIRIDPTAAEQVWAVAEDGTRLHVWWLEDFTGGSADDPLVRDSAGRVVARDGEILTIPGQGAGHPELQGHRVCTGSGSLYVISADLE